MRIFDEIAKRYDLDNVRNVSTAGLPERYLYSRDHLHRYAFARWWSEHEPQSLILWVMLNPASRAPDAQNRHTLNRVVKRSLELGADGVLTVNLFAYCTKNPHELKRADDPIGPHNDQILNELTASASLTVAAWGADGRRFDRANEVRPWLKNAICFGVTEGGEPRHPRTMSRDAVSLSRTAPSTPRTRGGSAPSVTPVALAESPARTSATYNGDVFVRSRQRGGFRAHRPDCPRIAAVYATQVRRMPIAEAASLPGVEACRQCGPDLANQCMK